MDNGNISVIFLISNTLKMVHCLFLFLGKGLFNRVGYVLMIHAFYEQYGNHGTILDVGCGEGQLSDFLRPEDRVLYTGIDISDKAVEFAKTRRPLATFRQSAAEVFNVDNRLKFDNIIFGESVMYMDFKLILPKYRSFLSPNGTIFISHWFSKKFWYVNDVFAEASKLLRKVDEIEFLSSNVKKKIGTKIAAFKNW